MSAWQFQKANAIAEKNGWTKFSCMQNLYNCKCRKKFILLNNSLLYLVIII